MTNRSLITALFSTLLVLAACSKSEQEGPTAAEPLAPAQAPSAWHEQRISRYLREHAEAGAQSNTPQLVPYARAASMEGR